MKALIIALIALFALPARAEDRVGVREQYDDLMKTSGKWDYICNSSIVMGIFVGAGSLYSYNRSLYYKSQMKERDLTAHESREFEQWDGLANHLGYGAGALFGLAIFGNAMEIHYEAKSHAFALDMGVKF